MTWLGHSTVALDVDGVRLVSDPLLHQHAGILRRRGPAPDPRTWRDSAGVLLSHLHHDHAELRSLRLLDDAPVLTAPENARWLAGKGVAGATGLQQEDWFRLHDVEVRLTSAVHRHRPMPHRPNAANGHLIRSRAGVVWLAGDTELHQGIADLPDLAESAVDVAVVPVSGWGPRLSPGHLDPDGAARACAAVGARYAIPVHWGTLHTPAGQHLPRGWMDRPGIQFARAVSRHAPGCEAVVIPTGESWTLRSSRW